MRSLNIIGQIGLTSLAKLFVLAVVGLSIQQSANADDKDKLRNSTWDTKYKGDGVPTTRAYVYFNGDEGKYRALDDDNNVILRGRFTDVEVKKKGDHYLITGKWEAAGTSGSFKFKVDEDDLSSFSGTWDSDDGSREGTWRGTRKPVPFIP